MTPRHYLIYGIAVLTLSGFAWFRGWNLSSISEAKSSTYEASSGFWGFVGGSLRENPGSDRSTYGSYHSYSGGK